MQESRNGISEAEARASSLIGSVIEVVANLHDYLKAQSFVLQL
jgi:hypothetical protein